MRYFFSTSDTGDTSNAANSIDASKTSGSVTFELFCFISILNHSLIGNPKIPPRLLFRHVLAVLRSNSRSIVAIKLTIQTPPTFSFHPLYPRSCQHRNNNNSNYFPFVKFHICLCLWMGSLLGLFRFLLHFLFGFTLCIRCFLSQSSLLFLCWRIFSPESLIFLDCFLATYVVQCKVSQKSRKFDAT